ncbi:MAG: phosphotransferase [Burkholderiaceae bacterium]
MISPQAIEWADTKRAQNFQHWLHGVQAAHGLELDSLCLASADASFRRYFRIDAGGCNRIIMDAPPDKENCEAFDHVARVMAAAGLNVPQVLAWDRAGGFMLLSDLGTQTMMQAIVTQPNQDQLSLYLRAVEVLLAWQCASKPDVLPPYDEALLLRELELFPEWYLAQHHRLTIDSTQRGVLDRTFQTIVRENLARPRVFVHRDFMPRNLMMPQTRCVAGDSGSQQGAVEQRLGVLDFQDAVYGPITYDIASLMRDAFLSWDEQFVLDVTIRYWEKARAVGLPVGRDFGDFYRGVEWMGLQRHLKICGIFARLTLRDGKPQYLADTPRFIGYIRATASRYRELTPLLRLIDKVEGTGDVSGYAFGRI